MTYNIHWLIADLILIADVMANSLLGPEFYNLFTGIGVPGKAVNAFTSILELIRIVVLLRENHSK